MHYQTGVSESPTLDLLSPSGHCCELAGFFFDCLHSGTHRSFIGSDDEMRGRWNSAAEFLNLAGGTSYVVIDPKRLNRAGIFARADHKVSICCASELVKEVVVFNLIWSALESTVALIKFRLATLSMSSADLAIRFLRSHYDPDPPVCHYEQALRDLHSRLSGWPGLRHRQHGGKAPSSIGVAGSGLDAARNLRALLLAGARGFPANRERRPDRSLDTGTLQLCSRLVLFSIQHLLLALMKKESSSAFRDEDDSMYDLEAEKLLKVLHLAPHGTKRQPDVELVESV